MIQLISVNIPYGLQKNVFSPVFGCSIPYLFIISINCALYNIAILVLFFLDQLILSITEKSVLISDKDGGFVSLSLYDRF